MAWTLTHDAAVFAALAREALESDPLRNTVTLTLLAQELAAVKGPSGTCWATCTVDGELIGAASVTPGYPILIAFAPEDSLQDLVTTLIANTVQVAGVNSRVELSDAFRDLWIAETGASLDHSMAERLFRLKGPLLEPNVQGSWRFATEEDDALLLKWLTAFGVDAGVTMLDTPARIADRHDYNGWVLWEDAGHPVSLAGLNRISGGMSRIGPVYTPAEQRGHGYAAASTAAATSVALKRGAQIVCLFTDLGNPVTNRLYPRLGYAPVEDRAVHHFTA